MRGLCRMESFGQRRVPMGDVAYDISTAEDQSRQAHAEAARIGGQLLHLNRHARTRDDAHVGRLSRQPEAVTTVYDRFREQFDAVDQQTQVGIARRGAARRGKPLLEPRKVEKWSVAHCNVGWDDLTARSFYFARGLSQEA